MTKQTVMPEWYTNYAMDILSNQQAVAARPFQEYVDASGKAIPRVADFAPDQQAGFEATRQGAFTFRPELGTASTKTQDVFGRSALGAAQPYFGQAAGMSGLAAATPGLQQGAGYVAGSTDALGLQMAQPYLAQAGQTAAQTVGQYMNPYNEAVTNRIAELGTRNLTENLLPAVEGRYIQAGQLGYGGRDGMGTPSGMMTDTARTLRDVNADILAQQTAALQSGYNQAAGLAGTDLSRFGTLANTAGGLAQTQQAQQLAASGALSNLGARAQELGLTGAGAIGNVGALQQQQGQRNLDVAYADFLRQQGYEQEQINNLLKTFQGTASGVPSATQEYGLSPSGVQQQYSSTGKDIASALTAAAGIVGSLKGK
jgi:hypothetical protein